jgi:hypothetical protein
MDLLGTRMRVIAFGFQIASLVVSATGGALIFSLYISKERGYFILARASSQVLFLPSKYYFWRRFAEMGKRLTSKAGKELAVLGASRGGRARAAVLSKEQRSEIARNAVKARWAKQKGTSANDQGQVSVPDHSEKLEKRVVASLPVSMFQGKLLIGGEEFVCHVLNNLKRVMAQREIVRILTGIEKGGLDRYLNALNLKSYINKDLILDQTIRFSIPGTNMESNGFEGTLLLDICDAYLRARDDRKLHESQTDLARRAETITRACAKVGIIALIDEATGFQKYRASRELQFKLQAFIADDMQEWALMFPEEFWLELARLEGIRYSPRNRPLRWGRYVMMFVYDAIDPDVGRELRKINPDPHFLQNHHQWLKKFGRGKVRDQIMQVIPVMKLCSNIAEFKAKFAYVFKNTPLQLSFDENWLIEPEGAMQSA